LIAIIDSALLHVGVPKSGTTSIQRFLSLARDDLRNHGYAYPGFLGMENHLAFAAYASEEFARRRRVAQGEWHAWRRKFHDDFVRQTATARGRWIISSEHIASHLRTEEQIADLCALFTDAGISQLSVLLYVRRQDTMAAASHAQWVLDGQPKRFDVHEHIGFVHRYDFAGLIDAWVAHSIVRDVTVCLYPEFPGMPALIDGFCDAIGMRSRSRHRQPRLNRSPGHRSIARLRRVNAAADRLGPGLAGELRKRILADSGGPSFRLSAADSRLIMEAYRESNERTLAQVAARRRVDGYFDVRAGRGRPYR
jgi:hypothetical protein